MATIRFRNPLTGRIMSESSWSSLFGGPPLPPTPPDAPSGGLFGDDEDAEEYESGEKGYPNWYQDAGQKYGMVWKGWDGDMLDPKALEDADFPSGYNRFQIRFSMPDNPSYPRGYSSYDTLYYTEWDTVSFTDLIRGVGAEGIAAIIFGS